MTQDAPTFSVDTGLFRQLGELLVGRDSTALVELVKNAYDADAQKVILIGRNLEDPERAQIDIVDDGTGMTAKQFTTGFLRLAARSKTAGNRRSSVFRRRYTGEKGVGRLAAHKLGALLLVETVAAGDEENQATVLRALSPAAAGKDLIAQIESSPKTLVRAVIDWDEIELVENIADIKDGLSVKQELTLAKLPGTNLSIRRLRHAWTPRDLAELSVQLENFSPPKVFVEPLSRSITEKAVLFERARVREAAADDPGMSVELEGDFAASEHWWPDTARSSDWILEVRAERGRPITYGAAPTTAGTQSNPHAKRVVAEVPHPAPNEGPFFDARIFLKSGQVSGVQRSWSSSNSGIRVYLEGFRVLPYGESRNDWLSLDLDYTRRAGKFELDPSLGGPESDLSELRDLRSRDVSLRLQPNRNFYGAVFITEDSAGGLKSLVNREGFVPDEPYERLVAMVRTGLDLLHRAWALSSLQKKQADRAAARNTTKPPLSDGRGYTSTTADARREHEQPWDDDVPGEEFASESSSEGSGTLLLRRISELESAVERGDLLQASSITADVRNAAERVLEDASLLRVLASVGSQLAAYTHEIGHLVAVSRGAEEVLLPRPGERWPARLGSVRDSLKDLTRAVERQASFLNDFSATESRRRRGRLNLHDRVSAAAMSVQTALAAANSSIEVDIPGELLTPPMFRADLQSILSNLLSNAVKAVNEGGSIFVSAQQTPQHLEIQVANTGKPVNVAESERLFVPYVSDSSAVDPVLSQGMGLGLPITRQIVSEYGGTIQFTTPPPGYATSIRLQLPR